MGKEYCESLGKGKPIRELALTAEQEETARRLLAQHGAFRQNRSVAKLDIFLHDLAELYMSTKRVPLGQGSKGAEARVIELQNQVQVQLAKEADILQAQKICQAENEQLQAQLTKLEKDLEVKEAQIAGQDQKLVMYSQQIDDLKANSKAKGKTGGGSGIMSDVTSTQMSKQLLKLNSKESAKLKQEVNRINDMLEEKKELNLALEQLNGWLTTRVETLQNQLLDKGIEPVD